MGYYTFGYGKLLPEEFSDEESSLVKMIQDEINDLHKQLELEITALNDKATTKQHAKDVYEVYETFNNGQDDSGKQNNFGRHCKLWHELQSKLHCNLKRISDNQGRGYKCSDNSQGCPSFCHHCWQYFGCYASK